mmetsp:Transcript_40388/g.84053  ORF Transcript_40388/g.84053 Transcript_40388/m.84053 type:complete len:348 (-) Transcript_40388:141-1184(-)
MASGGSKKKRQRTVAAMAASVMGDSIIEDWRRSIAERQARRRKVEADLHRDTQLHNQLDFNSDKAAWLRGQLNAHNKQLDDLNQEIQTKREQLGRLIQQAASSVSLEWQAPYPLLATTGSKWEYQPDEKIFDTLREEITNHFRYWEQGKGDNQNHPLFLVCSGPDTGKSRLLTAFPRLAVEAIRTGPLHEKLCGAYVFNVSFENDTADDPFDDVDLSIGTRMLWQMTSRKGETWSRFCHHDRTSIGDALQSLATLVEKPLQDLSIFLFVDRVQNLHHELGKKGTPFYKCFASVVSVVNATGGPFVVGAATIRRPVHDVLSDSAQKRVYLEPPAVNGEKIIDVGDDPC